MTHRLINNLDTNNMYVMDHMEAGIAPMFSGIQISEPLRTAYMPQGPMELDLKSEVECGGGYMDACYPPPPSMSLCSSPTGAITPGRQRKNKEDKICGVCGDRALGYNFDAISCESCKAFFRRNAPKGLEYFKCPYDEKCKMDISNRRFCKRCRLRKCFEIGMRKEYILTEEEKARKRQKIEENRTEKAHDISKQSLQREKQCVTPAPNFDKEAGNHPYNPFRMTRELEKTSIEAAAAPPAIPPPLPSPELSMTYSESSEPSSDSPGSDSARMCPLSQEDSELIKELQQAYDGSLVVKDDKTLPVSRDSASNMVDLVNIAEISVRRVIDMAKKIPTFRMLPQCDQISLLKGGSIELLILRSVITFDREKRHFLDPYDNEEQSAMNLEQLEKAEGSGLFEDHMKFVHSLAVELQADQITLILLLVVSLFSPDRPNLCHKEVVGTQQEKYSELLRKYLEAVHPLSVARNIFPKLLMKLTDIRNLNEEHSQVLLKVNPESIQPLMLEVLDLRA